MVEGKEKLAETLSEVWGLLTEEQQVLLAKNTSIQHLQRNDIIYEHGGKPCCLLCLVSGKVKIYKEGVGGRQQIIRMVRPKDFFGYRASFVGENYITTAAAFEESEVLCIPIYVAQDIIKANSAVSIYFLRELAAHLGYAEETTVSLTQKHVRARLAEALLRLKQSFGTAKGCDTLAIAVSREDLANLANMTTSNAIRTLSAFVQEGLVKADGRKLTILDEPRLRTVSEEG